jgi:hypothetical protein
MVLWIPEHHPQLLLLVELSPYISYFVIDLNILFPQVGLLFKFVLLEALLSFSVPHTISRIDIMRLKYFGSGIMEGQDDTRNFGRRFVTTGWTVMQVSVAVAVVELGRGVLSLGLCI